MTAHTLTKDNQDMVGSVFKNDPDDTDYDLQPQSKSITKLLYGIESEIEHALGDVGF